MSRVLLVYSPFCSPAVPPYSLTYLQTFLKNNLDKVKSDIVDVDVLDLNVFYHNLAFPEHKEYLQSLSENFEREDYETKSLAYRQLTDKNYSMNNKRVLAGEKPDFFDEVLKSILDKKPDYVAFSIVYSSQAFYANALINELKSKGIKTIVGGPSVNSKLINLADVYLKHELELLDYFVDGKLDHDSLDFSRVIDYSGYEVKDYFNPTPVLSLKTCSACYYKRCAFCTHHMNQYYFEYSIDDIRKTVENAISDMGVKRFFLVDDMISKKRLLDLAKIFKDNNCEWICQLRPTKELDENTLKYLFDSGLKVIILGVESGSQKVLDLMRKGTKVEDIDKVLRNSKIAGIMNVVYMMIGFPGEEKEDFLETIDLLQRHKDNIDLVSTSVFGLQEGTPVFLNYKEYGIKEIRRIPRTVLDDRIEYDVESGFSQDDAKSFRKKYKKTLESFNKFPKQMNFFREHMLCLWDKI